jgi:MerR family transcriptional regulator, heat shock protein HspR
MARAKSKAAFMISAVAEQYGVHPQTLRLYEREGLLKPSRSEGNTRFIPPRTSSGWRSFCT